jgi:hypothetical protein
VINKFVLARWFAGIALVPCLAVSAAAQGSLSDVPLPLTEPEQKVVVADIKAKAFDFEKNLPDFSCNQLSHRNQDAKGMNQWKTLETTSEHVRVTKRVAEYTLVAQNGKKAAGTEKRPANLVDMQQFIDVLHDIFDPNVKAEFVWTGWDSVRGHRVHMITFALRKDNSTFTVGKKGITAGLTGIIYADADTNAILRIVIVATEVPAKYPIQGTSWDMNYEFIRLGDKIQLLPYKADIRGKEGHAQIWDEAEMKDFKKP